MNKKYRSKPHQSSERAQFTVVLEDIRSQFKVFGEGLAGLREHTDHRFDRIEERLLRIEERLARVEERLLKLEADMEIMKSELAVIRHNQITRSEFQLLETRVKRLERLVSHR